MKHFYYHILITVPLSGFIAAKRMSRCLRFVFNDRHSTYDELLDYLNQPPCLQDRRMHDMLTLTYRALNGNTPVYIKNLLNFKDTTYNLRGQHLLNVPRVNTTTYGLHSFRYFASNSGTHYQTHLEPLLRPMHLN